MRTRYWDAMNGGLESTTQSRRCCWCGFSLDCGFVSVTLPFWILHLVVAKNIHHGSDCLEDGDAPQSSCRWMPNINIRTLQSGPKAQDKEGPRGPIEVIRIRLGRARTSLKDLRKQKDPRPYQRQSRLYRLHILSPVMTYSQKELSSAYRPGCKPALTSRSGYGVTGPI